MIEDENAPQIRGKRMACATIRRSHPITAVVNEWRSSAGISANITGYIEMHQQSIFDETKIKINLRGLNKLASGYHVHKVYLDIFSFIVQSDRSLFHFFFVRHLFRLIKNFLVPVMFYMVIIIHLKLIHKLDHFHRSDQLMNMKRVI